MSLDFAVDTCDSRVSVCIVLERASVILRVVLRVVVSFVAVAVGVMVVAV
jgi:hypothetical protein